MKTSKPSHTCRNRISYPGMASVYTVITVSTLASLTAHVVDDSAHGLRAFLLAFAWSLVATGMVAATVVQWIEYARKVNPPAEAPEGESPSL